MCSHQGWLAGANLSFNPQQGKLNKTNFALGYQDKDIQVHTNVYVLLTFKRLA